MIEPIWDVAPPSPEMHRRIAEVCARELRKREHTRWLSGGLANAGAVVIVAVAFQADFHRAPPLNTATRTLTGFYSLMDAPPSFGNGVLVCTTVPESALAIAGIPVPEGHAQDSIDADLLIGEDGIVRAIRFAGY